jgi:hypothetical protein
MGAKSIARRRFAVILATLIDTVVLDKIRQWIYRFVMNFKTKRKKNRLKILYCLYEINIIVNLITCWQEISIFCSYIRKEFWVKTNYLQHIGIISCKFALFRGHFLGEIIFAGPLFKNLNF